MPHAVPDVSPYFGIVDRFREASARRRGMRDETPGGVEADFGSGMRTIAPQNLVPLLYDLHLVLLQLAIGQFVGPGAQSLGGELYPISPHRHAAA